MRDEQAPEPKETPRYARFLGATGCWPVDDLGLIEAIDRLGERVVVRVADTAVFNQRYGALAIRGADHASSLTVRWWGGASLANTACFGF